MKINNIMKYDAEAVDHDDRAEVRSPRRRRETDDDNPNDHYPSATTINVLGYFQTYRNSDSDQVLRTWAAGGSGGTPGGTSVYNKFPGWFGDSGASGTVTVTQ